MAKTIKFNLICDNKPIRTIDDLQNNFLIEDVMEYYDNGLLDRWLEVRGYESELEKVRAITTDEVMEVAKQLIKIFNITIEDKKIEESIYILSFLKEREERFSIYQKKNYQMNKIIKDYQIRYQQLVDGMLSNPNDIAIIKANICEMVSNYTWIFELNHRALFYELMEQSSLAIMCLLMNEHSRKYYLIEDENLTYDIDIEEMFEDICNMIQTNDFKTELGENLITFSGVTDGYWKDLEPKGKKYMIISMGQGDFVRAAGVSGGDLKSEDITNKFIILDGVDYKSKYSTHKLLYMEV
ncbi:MAG: hypothetical protein K1W16_15555 [Lachnospiraceae bacterium]